MGVRSGPPATLRRGDVARLTPEPALVADFAADYADAFRMPADDGRTARDWAAASLAGAEVAGGAFARLAWHGLLGFELAPRGTAGTVVGWRVSVDEPQRCVLDVDGRLMAGRIVFALTEGVVTWTTMLRYHRPAAGRVWAVAGHLHRALAPRCLNAARRTLARP
jgi:hypothetical protein